MWNFFIELRLQLVQSEPWPQRQRGFVVLLRSRPRGSQATPGHFRVSNWAKNCLCYWLHWKAVLQVHRYDIHCNYPFLFVKVCEIHSSGAKTVACWTHHLIMLLASFLGPLSICAFFHLFSTECICLSRNHPIPSQVPAAALRGLHLCTAPPAVVLTSRAARWDQRPDRWNSFNM